MLRAGLAAFGTAVCLAQVRMPEAIRSEAGPTPAQWAQAQSAPLQRTPLDPLTNWAAPLYWRPGPATAQSAARAMRAESGGASEAPPSSTFGEPAIFVAVQPCRLVDTRAGAGFTAAFGPPALAANTPRTIPVPSSSCGIPSGAVAYSINFFVVPAPGALVGYAQAWPDDQPQPSTAVLTDTVPGAVIGSAAIVAAGLDGGFDVLTQLSTDVVIDINGYFVMPSSLPLGGTPVAPALTFGDSTTGLFSTAPGTLSIATEGVTALTVSPNGDLDLRGSITKQGSLFLHNIGANNTAAGLGALALNTGSGNTALGASALQANTTGDGNTAVGGSALEYLNTGSNNTALGPNAGLTLISGSYNIFIANVGTGSSYYGGPGGPAAFDTESNTIRIGDTNQNRTFIAGISGTTTGLSGALPVVIDANGQLGTISSSRRVKRDIADMGDTTETLMSLRPVQFRYNAYGPDSPLQFGLIAEEVAEVAPDLVARKANGEVETVFYDKVNAMLLNEVQKLRRENKASQHRIATHDAELQTQRDQFAAALRQLESRLAALEAAGAK
jgi:hypothetical protein